MLPTMEKFSEWYEAHKDRRPGPDELVRCKQLHFIEGKLLNTYNGFILGETLYQKEMFCGIKFNYDTLYTIWVREADTKIDLVNNPYPRYAIVWVEVECEPKQATGALPPKEQEIHDMDERIKALDKEVAALRRRRRELQDNTDITQRLFIRNIDGVLELVVDTFINGRSTGIPSQRIYTFCARDYGYLNGLPDMIKPGRRAEVEILPKK